LLKIVSSIQLLFKQRYIHFSRGEVRGARSPGEMFLTRCANVCPSSCRHATAVS